MLQSDMSKKLRAENHKQLAKMHQKEIVPFFNNSKYFFFQNQVLKSYAVKTSNLEFSLHKSAPLVYVSLSAVVLPTFANLSI